MSNERIGIEILDVRFVAGSVFCVPGFASQITDHGLQITDHGSLNNSTIKNE